MCGIVGYAGNRDAAQILLESLEKLEYRGYDSAGIAIAEEGAITIRKSRGRLNELRKKIGEEGCPAGTCGIGHTRWATHGEPSDVNSHPHGNSEITIVHNGIIENYRQLKDFLSGQGYEFQSETDTESVAKLLHFNYDGDPVATIIKTIGQIDGSYALGVLFKDFPGRIYAVRRGSPLIAAKGEGENFIASDVTAVLSYTRDYYLLDEDEIAVLSADEIKFFDIHYIPVKKELYHAGWDAESAQKGGYEHFMMKEIREQPGAIRKTCTGRIGGNGVPDLSECGLTEELLALYRKIFIVACGTAMHAGTVAKYVIEKLARVEVTVDIASEFRYRNPILMSEDLVIIISQSGETADSLEALKLAKRMGASTLAIVNVVGSSISREADMVLYTYAGPEISVASTKAYMTQLVILYLFAFELAFARRRISTARCAELTAGILAAADRIENDVFTDAQQDLCRFAASKLVSSVSLLYIGRGLDYAMSMEGSLKLKEISYIHSESYAAGELKHGTISLVTDRMYVIAVATQHELLEKTISNLREVKARGANVLLVCAGDMEIAADAADLIIRLPVLDDLLMPLISVVPLQEIAYYTAVLRGNDVDRPRNLAKSVTVE